MRYIFENMQNEQITHGVAFEKSFGRSRVDIAITEMAFVYKVFDLIRFSLTNDTQQLSEHSNSHRGTVYGKKSPPNDTFLFDLR